MTRWNRHAFLACLSTGIGTAAAGCGVTTSGHGKTQTELVQDGALADAGADAPGAESSITDVTTPNVYPGCTVEAEAGNSVCHEYELLVCTVTGSEFGSCRPSGAGYSADAGLYLICCPP